MLSDRAALLAALRAKDTRFDGYFFTGITSTGIYCRPVCKARQAKDENCAFFRTAAQAEQAGYRPCLLCRPELAPGQAATGERRSLALRAARLLEESCGESLAEITARLGCTDWRLRRAFADEYSVTPVQYLQTCRLLLAKNLLTDTSLSIPEVAMISGVGSVRRLNGLFQKRYRLLPEALRKSAVKAEKHGGAISLLLGYRPPYPWEATLDFLAMRAIKGVEAVRDGEYLRTVRVANGAGKQVSGWIKVTHAPRKNALSLTISSPLLPALPRVMARVRRLFDLDCDPRVIYSTLQIMNEIRPGLCVLGTRLPGCFDAFEMVARAVLGQQITVKAAGTLAGRLVEAYGTPLDTGTESLTHIFPSPEELLALEGDIEESLGRLGVVAARSRTIHTLARAFMEREIDFSLCADPEIEIKKLVDIRGVGSWTAQYIAMRAMEWQDAFLETDAGIKKALSPRTPKEILEMSEAWRPWRSYAVVNLWNSL